MFASSNRLNFINFKDLLKKFDQESLFRKYTNLNVDGYNYSIFRADKSPMCRFEWHNGLLYYIDNATYKGKLAFDIIEVLSELYNISKLEAAYKIIKENNVDVSKKIVGHESNLSKLDIRFKKGIWKKDNYMLLDPDILEYENVFKVDSYWVNNGDGFKQNHIYNPKEVLTIAYYFPDSDTVKLYFPGQQFRFFTNCSPSDIYISPDLLSADNTMILTKSNKDRLLFKYMYGYESVAPQSENQTIPLEIIDLIKSYKTYYTIFDGDNTGIRFANNLYLKHNIPYKFLDLGKDLYDITIEHGENNIQKYLKSYII